MFVRFPKSQSPHRRQSEQDVSFRLNRRRKWEIYMTIRFTFQHAGNQLDALSSNRSMVNQLFRNNANADVSRPKTRRRRTRLLRRFVLPDFQKYQFVVDVNHRSRLFFSWSQRNVSRDWSFLNCKAVRLAANRLASTTDELLSSFLSHLVSRRTRKVCGYRRRRSYR